MLKTKARILATSSHSARTVRERPVFSGAFKIMSIAQFTVFAISGSVPPAVAVGQPLAFSLYRDFDPPAIAGGTDIILRPSQSATTSSDAQTQAKHLN